MDIDYIELVHFTEDKSDVPNFIIHYKGTDLTSAVLSNATANRHYLEVKEWYNAQKKKPFKFNFIDL